MIKDIEMIYNKDMENPRIVYGLIFIGYCKIKFQYL